MPFGCYKHSPNPGRPGFRKNAITLYAWGLVINAICSLTASLSPQFRLALLLTLRRWWRRFPTDLCLSDKALFVILHPRW